MHEDLYLWNNTGPYLLSLQISTELQDAFWQFAICWHRDRETNAFHHDLSELTPPDNLH